MSAPLRLAVLGDPLRFTLSPVLHRAGAAAVGRVAESVALRTTAADLPATLARLAAEGHVGCNLTMPLKEPALTLVTDATPRSRAAGSVNTVTFTATGVHGDTTDGPGFLDLLAELDREPQGVLLLGAGGSARSLAQALAEVGAPPAVVSRRDPGAEGVWSGAVRAAWGSEAARAQLARARVVVNATPLGADELAPLLADLAAGTLVIDLVYEEHLTPWCMAARARGLEAHDGLGLLVHQARRSLTRWCGAEVPLAPLAAAVGWPR